MKVDQCASCAGFWLDGGELLQIVNQFENEADKREATKQLFEKLWSEAKNKNI